MFQSSWRLETEVWLSDGNAEVKVVVARRAMIDSLDSMIAAVEVLVSRKAEYISDKHLLFRDVKIVL
jgi:hypothetical protein